MEGQARAAQIEAWQRAQTGAYPRELTSDYLKVDSLYFSAAISAIHSNPSAQFAANCLESVCKTPQFRSANG